MKNAFVIYIRWQIDIKNTISLAMEVEPSDEEFYTHMKHGIQKLKRNTQIVLKIGGNVVR